MLSFHGGDFSRLTFMLSQRKDKRLVQYLKRETKKLIRLAEKVSKMPHKTISWMFTWLKIQKGWLQDTFPF